MTDSVFIVMERREWEMVLLVLFIKVLLHIILELPVFIPVTFEMTVLLAAFGMVGTFLVVSDLKPWGKPKTFDLRSTDDKHVMAIEIEKNSMSETQLKKLLESNGASETNTKLMEE